MPVTKNATEAPDDTVWAHGTQNFADSSRSILQLPVEHYSSLIQLAVHVYESLNVVPMHKAVAQILIA